MPRQRNPGYKRSPHLDPRIEQWRDQVGEQIGEHDGDGRDKHHAHDDGDVDALDRLSGELADAGPVRYAARWSFTAMDGSESSIY
jgi:hypothetical protein